MMKVQDFAELPRQKGKPNYLQIMKNKYDLGPGFDSVLDLKQEQQNEVRLLTREYANDTVLNWRRHMGAFIKWTDPQFVNYEFLDKSSHPEPD